MTSAKPRAEGCPFTVETCPHYLTFAAEEVPDGDPRFQVCPADPRTAQREHLRHRLRDGRIHTIGSDHSPAPPG